LCGAETWTFWKVDQKYLESFEMCYWRRMEKISWTDRVRNKDVLVTVREKQNILHTIKGKKIVLVAFWIGSALRKKVVKDIWKRREGEEEDVISYSVTWGNEKILEIERGSTRSRSV
jgi:hypothetical protein